MELGSPFIRLKLDTDEPIELGEFVGAFTALGAEYDKFVRASDPDQFPAASLFVREVRKGSIYAELVIAAGGFVGLLAAANTMHEFVERYGDRLAEYLKPGGRAKDASKAELKHFSEQVAAIASTPGAALEVAAIEVENGEQKIRAVFKFDTNQARDIERRVSEHKLELEHASGTDHARVLMVFTRSDVRTTAVGKRSGELVRIGTISDRSLPLIYASELAEREIKHEISEAEDNVYKKGFVVDVNVEDRNGKPLAYRVTNLHRVIDLPDDA